ncbi:hypothetical protein CERSUDRAFT_126265 [Gelatoporia subvermispora B]|uniref:Uncharacterized protein n=1 Tax=Ceriporiopsis subvermispora (strain B) TaxID=914234 RepID=M2Q8C1_CERS8|nr:hypothetical protein CERSUDRAFT_126265 [Gelatoporia subvermispora B]
MGGLVLGDAKRAANLDEMRYPIAQAWADVPAHMRARSGRSKADALRRRSPARTLSGSLARAPAYPDAGAGRPTHVAAACAIHLVSWPEPKDVCTPVQVRLHGCTHGQNSPSVADAAKERDDLPGRGRRESCLVLGRSITGIAGDRAPWDGHACLSPQPGLRTARAVGSHGASTLYESGGGARARGCGAIGNTCRPHPPPLLASADFSDEDETPWYLQMLGAKEKHVRKLEWALVAAWVLFLCARAILCVEMFIGLRRMPYGVYETVPWTYYIPHI